jgi:hypothetical protein
MLPHVNAAHYTYVGLALGTGNPLLTPIWRNSGARCSSVKPKP